MPSHTNTFRVASAALAATVAVLLAGCGSGDSSSDATSAAASPSATGALPSATESPIGGDVLPPVMIDSGATSAEAKVGDTLVFNVPDPVNTKISSTDTSVLELQQGYTDGSATFNPSATAIANGTAVVTVTEPGKAPYEVSITIS
ncbi:MAG: hypothetical protein H6525_04690 [Actinobacteria bacterium]|nr:hypothetical protein [Actinomycetota bacterium]